MIEILIIAVLGTALAGLWDLRTTEVPDQLPYAMVGIGVIYWLGNWLLNGDSGPLVISLAVGTLLLALGMILYKKGQWGGADAWILAAIGYMIPLYNGSIFIVPYLFNFMLVSIAYTVIYALAIGLMNRSVFPYVAKDLRQNKKIVLGLPLAFLAVTFVISLVQPYAGLRFFNVFALIVLLVFFWRYATVIEKRIFRKKIPSSRLKAGDVLDDSKWVGLTNQQIKHLKKKKRFVVIKDGMRFVPVFVIALVVTLLFGNLFFIIFSV